MIWREEKSLAAPCHGLICCDVQTSLLTTELHQMSVWFSTTVWQIFKAFSASGLRQNLRFLRMQSEQEGNADLSATLQPGRGPGM